MFKISVLMKWRCVCERWIRKSIARTTVFFLLLVFLYFWLIYFKKLSPSSFPKCLPLPELCSQNPTLAEFIYALHHLHQTSKWSKRRQRDLRRHQVFLHRSLVKSANLVQTGDWFECTWASDFGFLFLILSIQKYFLNSTMVFC